MFSWPPKVETPLDPQITRAIAALDAHEVTSKEYGETMTKVEKLMKMRDAQRPNLPSADTVIMASTHLLGILLIIRHEHVNVITSKAMSFVPKPK